jgi:myo-inositol 2-dehydrogenase/D-chiro-inositol 1-dehydrogenase
MRLGLLGCGSIAYWMHLRALQHLPGATFVAAADPDATARERAGRLAGVRVYERSDELIAHPDIEAIVICAPSHLHAELAVASAKAGKHFYLEKPIAITAEDAARVIDATSQAGVHAVMGFNRRFHPLYQQARGLITANRIGRVRAVQTVCCEPMPIPTMSPWRHHRASGGGVLLELASHHIDQIRWLLEDDVVSATASLRSDLSEDDVGRVELVTQGGVEVQGFFSFRNGCTDYMELIGDRGSLRIDRHCPPLSLRVEQRLGYGVRKLPVRPTLDTTMWRFQRLLRPSIDPSFRRSLQAFVDGARGRASRSATLVDGLRSLEVILASESSGRPCARS